MTETATLPKRPTTMEELSATIANAHAAGTQVRIAGSDSLPLTRFDPARPVQAVTTLRMNKVLEHAVGDMTVIVQAGVTLEALQKQLAWQNQWLPIDPPAVGGRSPGQRTLGGLIASNTLGPLRFGSGDFRLLIMGMRWVDGTGTIIKAGGRTVKNSAGYASHRMMIGACGSLGAIGEITLRTFARPADEQCVFFFCENYAAAEQLIAETFESSTTPAYIQLIVGGAFTGNPLQLPTSRAIVAIGFLNRPHVCANQVETLRALPAAKSIDSIAQTAAQAGRLRLWMTSEPPGDIGFRAQCLSSDVCALAEEIEKLAAAMNGGCWLVSEAGNGVLRGSARLADVPAFWRELSSLAAARNATLLATHGLLVDAASTCDREISLRIKAQLDPRNIFGLPPIT